MTKAPHSSNTSVRKASVRREQSTATIPPSTVVEETASMNPTPTMGPTPTTDTSNMCHSYADAARQYSGIPLGVNISPSTFIRDVANTGSAMAPEPTLPAAPPAGGNQPAQLRTPTLADADTTMPTSGSNVPPQTVATHLVGHNPPEQTHATDPGTTISPSLPEEDVIMANNMPISPTQDIALSAPTAKRPIEATNSELNNQDEMAESHGDRVRKKRKTGEVAPNPPPTSSQQPPVIQPPPSAASAQESTHTLSLQPVLPALVPFNSPSPVPPVPVPSVASFQPTLPVLLSPPPLDDINCSHGRSPNYLNMGILPIRLSLMAQLTHFRAAVFDSRRIDEPGQLAERTHRVLAAEAGTPMDTIRIGIPDYESVPSAGTHWFFVSGLPNQVVTSFLQRGHVDNDYGQVVLAPQNPPPSSLVATFEVQGELKGGDQHEFNDAFRHELMNSSGFGTWIRSFGDNFPPDLPLDQWVHYTVESAHFHHFLIARSGGLTQPMVNIHIRPPSGDWERHEAFIKAFRSIRLFGPWWTAKIHDGYHCNRCHSDGHPGGMCPLPLGNGWRGPAPQVSPNTATPPADVSFATAVPVAPQAFPSNTTTTSPRGTQTGRGSRGRGGTNYRGSRGGRGGWKGKNKE